MSGLNPIARHKARQAAAKLRGEWKAEMDEHHARHDINRLCRRYGLIKTNAFGRCYNESHPELNSSRDLVDKLLKGDLEYVERLVDSNSHSYEHLDLAAVFNFICIKGLTDVAKWIISRWSEIICVGRYHNVHAFIAACTFGHLEMVTWLVYENPKLLAHLNDQTYLAICRAGHIEMLKWLCEVRPDIEPVNIESINFRTLYEVAHFDMLKYLIIKRNIRTNIHIQDIIDLVITDYKDRVKPIVIETMETYPICEINLADEILSFI